MSFRGNAVMKLLEEKIIREGRVAAGNILKVDCFLNHQIDVAFLNEMGKEFARLFYEDKVDKILTVEASGIAIACIAAQHFGNIPVIFAKKSKTLNISGDVYTSSVESYTHKTVNTIMISKDFLKAGDRVLIIDDFLANGFALEGMIELCNQAKAHVVGAGIAIEKAYQRGGDRIRAKGFRVESLAKIKEMSECGEIVFE